MNELKIRSEKAEQYKGNGYILFYHFDEEFVRMETFLPETLKNNYCGGLGAVIYLNFTETKIGPYEELLFIPGKFCYRGKKNHFISKVYTSKDETVNSSYGNWGTLQKEKASFSHEKPANHVENITAYINGDDFASFEFKSRRLQFRIKTRKRLSFSLMKLDGDNPIELNYFGKATAKFCRLESIKIRPLFFPDIAKFSPLCIFKLKNLTLRFPKKE